MWMIVGLSAAPSTIIWSYIAKKIGSSRALIYAYLNQLISILILVLFTNLFSIVLSSILFGATFIGIVNLTLSFGKSLSQKDSTLIVGILTAGYGLGQIIGPIVAGYLAEKSGNFSSSLWVSGGFLLFSLIFMVIEERGSLSKS
jgi:predicted MFS family arabinose efflux permease